MSKEVYAIVVAGGSGSRMGGGVPKQFLRLGGKTVLHLTIERLKEAIPEVKIITVLPRACFQTWKAICEEDSIDYPQRLAEGGITRFQSVRNALAKVPEGAIVMVHDGVRPFASVAMIRSMLALMRESSCEALIPALAVSDTLRSTNPSLPSPDRSELVAVQTPQFFCSSLLKQAYSQPYKTSFTDDASVAESFGAKIQIAQGEKFNIKLTTPEDLDLARFILSLQK